uniref:Secreted protein n=1 Tax=Ascaris lumbricoides TaxID=6252 RepID=A0A0M3I0U1_ASCLU
MRMYLSVYLSANFISRTTDAEVVDFRVHHKAKVWKLLPNFVLLASVVSGSKFLHGLIEHNKQVQHKYIRTTMCRCGIAEHTLQVRICVDI